MKFHYYFDNEEKSGWSDYYVHQELHKTPVFEKMHKLKERNEYHAKEYCQDRNKFVSFMEQNKYVVTLFVLVLGRKVEVWHSCFVQKMKGIRNTYWLFGIHGAHASASFKCMDVEDFIYPIDDCHRIDYSQFPVLPEEDAYQGDVTLESVEVSGNGVTSRVYCDKNPNIFILDPLIAWRYLHFTEHDPEDLFQTLMNVNGRKEIDYEHAVDFVNFLWCVSKGFMMFMDPSTDYNYIKTDRLLFEKMDVLQSKVFKHIMDDDNWF